MLLVVVYGAVVALLVVRAARPVRAADVARWAASVGLPADVDPVLIRRYLRRGRWFRTIGFLIPFVIGVSSSWYSAMVEGRPRPPFPFTLFGVPAWIGGYLLGALLAELTWPRPSGRRGAALAPRRVSDYLPAWVLVVARGIALGALITVALEYWVFPQYILPGFRPGLGPGALALAALIPMEIALWAIVHRRQPVASVSDLALDDGFRASSIRRVAGASLASLFLVLGDLLFKLGAGISPQLLRWTLPWIGLACIFALAPASWFHIANPLQWPVRRGLVSAEDGPRG